MYAVHALIDLQDNIDRYGINPSQSIILRTMCEVPTFRKRHECIHTSMHRTLSFWCLRSCRIRRYSYTQEETLLHSSIGKGWS